MFVDFEDISFWASNIPKEVEQCISQVNDKVDKSFDTEEQKQAYHLGTREEIKWIIGSLKCS